MTTAAAPKSAGSSGPILVSEVEHELARCLQALGQAEHKPVLRAHLSNLIAFCRSEERAAELEREIPAIVAVHPARVLLLVAGGETGDELTASVQVRCHPDGDGQRISSEAITVRAPSRRVDRLPFAARSLVLGDLPINLWWAVPEPPALAGPILHDLGEPAQQILYDSIGWLEPVRGVVATAAWLGQGRRSDHRPDRRVVSDLNWRRLKKWRRSLAQALDPATAPGALDSITEVTITHGPHAVVQAWELGAWLAASLRWHVKPGHIEPGVEMAWDFASPGHDVRLRLRRLDAGPSNLRLVRVAFTLLGKPAALNITLEDEVRISVMPEGTPGTARTTTIPRDSFAELVGRQLSDRDRDRAFDHSMSVAHEMGRKIARP